MNFENEWANYRKECRKKDPNPDGTISVYVGCATEISVSTFTNLQKYADKDNAKIMIDNEDVFIVFNVPPNFLDIAEDALDVAVKYIQGKIGEKTGDFASTWDFKDIKLALENYAENNYYYLNYK